MSLNNLAFQATNGQFLDELPLVSAGPRTKFLKNFGTWSATLDTKHPACPEDWAQIIDDTYSINTLVDEDENIRWAGYPSGSTKNLDGTVSINYTSIEGFAGKINMQDYRKIGVDQSEIFSDFVDVLNAAGYGFIKRIEPTGTQAACIIKQSDNKSVLTAMQEQSSGTVSYEWKFAVEWTDDSHTAIQKVAYMAKKLGNTAEETTHVFELIPAEEGSGNEGNVVDYSEATSTADGSRATHVYGTGDGSGAKQLRTPTPEIDNERIAAGYPESQWVQPFPGVVRAADLLTAVQAFAKNLFKGNKALTLKVKDSEHTPIKSVELGDHVFVDISTSNLPVLKVMRVISTSEDNELDFDPQVVDPDVDPLFVPRADDPDALGRIIDGLGKVTPTDPFAGGFSVDKADGSGQWGLDTAKGFGSFDANGNFNGLDSRAGELFVQQAVGYSVAIMKDSRGIDFRYQPENGIESTASLRLGDAGTGVPGEQALVLSGPGANTSSNLRMGDNGSVSLSGSYGTVAMGGYSGTTLGNGGKATEVQGDGITLSTGFKPVTISNNAVVKGSLTVEGPKQFGMPHPVDDSLYVLHSATESDVNGVEYWGTAVCGPDGFATVKLNDYFEALTSLKLRAVLLTPVGSRSTFCHHGIVDGEFIMEADPGTVMDWNVKAVRVLLDEDGNDKLAYKSVIQREIVE